MSERRLKQMEIREIIRHIREGRSDRQIGKDLKVDRRTVKRYRQWAESQGLMAGALPDHESLLKQLDESLPEKRPPQNASKALPYREKIEQLLGEQVKVTAIHDRLKEQGYSGSYASVLRLAQQIRPKSMKTCVRKESAPGEEAEVDFGYVGMMLDEEGNAHKAWAFVMVLSWSRHMYVEFVWDQKVETWLKCHRNALAYFGGVPKRLVIDNLKSAVTQAMWDAPQVQQAYRECAEHYGFLILPCRPRTPEHKGKVEGGVGYVKGRFMGGKDQQRLSQANQEVRRWCQEAAGMRIHGTSKKQPMIQFETVEKAHLKALPQTPYDLAIWKQVKLHRDCHIVFEGSYYSAPFRLVGQSLWVCAGTQQVRLYNTVYELMATHERARQPGERKTHPDHYPQEKLPGLMRTREQCLEQAEALGQAVQQVVAAILSDPALDTVHQAGRLLGLCEHYGQERLEAACQRALKYADPSYKTIKGILKSTLEQEIQSPLVQLPVAQTFSRPVDELVGGLSEVQSWN